jgi:NADPH:quinone reductase-like Zn-dependent oxidoreductase
MAELFALLKSGVIRPRISARYPLKQGAEAIRVLQDREAVGKVVVTMGDQQ